MRRDDEVQRIAMEAAIAYEKAAGREPEDVSALKLGYDVRSRDAAGDVRYVEVKGRADEGNVIVTENEWIMARRLGPDYWLYVVTGARNPATAQVHGIQDPASRLNPEPQAQIVRYRVKRDDWKQAADQ